MTVKFPLGHVVISAKAMNVLPSPDVRAALARHARGDWGDLDQEDVQANELALHDGGRLLSVYHAGNSQKFYVITEHDRSATTILLPEDY